MTLAPGMEQRLADVVRRLIPRRVRYALQERITLTDLKTRWRQRSTPLSTVDASDENRAGSPFRFGIIKNPSYYHCYYVAACLEMGVPFRVIDVLEDDWLDRVRSSGCDFLLAWPDATLTVWANAIKDRLVLLERTLGFPVFPTSDEIWFYEDKIRLADWLRVKGVPHPRTWVYSSRQQALDFADLCSLPIVFKSPFGAAAAGVRVLKTRRALKRMVRRVFDLGFVPSGSHRRDRQWGRILLQEYLPDVREWRMVRIGDSFMCRLKERVGDYHSGSGLVAWAQPPVRVLDFARYVTDIGGFRSMDVDIFETVDGLLLVNELQAVFGGIRDSNLDRGVEHRGRWRWNPLEPAWQFEAGDFYRNACANERIRCILEESQGPTGMAHLRPGAKAYAEGEEAG